MERLVAGSRVLREFAADGAALSENRDHLNLLSSSAENADCHEWRTRNCGVFLC
jgi:hypothetical protein